MLLYFYITILYIYIFTDDSNANYATFFVVWASEKWLLLNLEIVTKWFLSGKRDTATSMPKRPRGESDKLYGMIDEKKNSLYRYLVAGHACLAGLIIILAENFLFLSGELTLRIACCEEYYHRSGQKTWSVSVLIMPRCPFNRSKNFLRREGVVWRGLAWLGVVWRFGLFLLK